MTPDATNLCRHYADVLRASGRSERTIDNYLYSLRGFTRFLGERTLDQATADDIVAYQVDVAARGRSDSCVRVATCALRGFLHHVLQRDDWNEARLPRSRRPRHLPEVLSAEEVAAILEAAPNLKYRAAHPPLRPAQQPRAPVAARPLARTPRRRCAAPARATRRVARRRVSAHLRGRPRAVSQVPQE
jgi:integrase